MPFSLENIITKANKLSADGLYDEAIILYNSILLKFPNNMRAKYGLEKSLSNGSNKDNIDIENEITIIVNHLSSNQLNLVIEKALLIVGLDIKNHIVFNLLGLAYFYQKNFSLAKLSYEQSLKVNSNFPEAWNNLGLTMKAMSNLEEAIVCFQKAIKINYQFVNAITNLANLYQENFNFKLSEKFYKQSLKIDPSLYKSFLGLGINYLNQKLYKLAKFNFQKALNLSLKSSEIHFAMGNLYFELKEYDNAISHYNLSLELNESCYRSYNNIGIIYNILEDYVKASISFEKSILINPKFDEVWNNFAVLKLNIGDYQGAISFHLKASQLNPLDETNLYNHAIVYKETGNLTKEIQYYDEALKIKPKSGQINFNKSVAFLNNENFEKGWDLYDWRWEVKLLNNKVTKPFVKFNFDKYYKKILIQAEQGLGDEILFTTIAKEFISYADKLTISLDKRLIHLFRISMPDITFIDRNEIVNFDNYNAVLSMGDLGQYIRRSNKDFLQNRSKPLISQKLENEKLDYILKKSIKPLIGISWYSSNNKGWKKKNISLMEMVKVFEGIDCNIISLQYGDFSKEIEEINNTYGLNIINLKEVDIYNNIDDLSFIIQKCDLVISTSNTTVHIAGAIGKPVWLLLPFISDWKWFKNRTDSLWYPNFKIFRQNSDRSWGEVIKEIRNILNKTIIRNNKIFNN